MKNILLLIVVVSSFSCKTQSEPAQSVTVPTNEVKNEPLSLGAEQFDVYLPLLAEKSVGVVTNHTAMVNDKHLVDLLLEKGVNIKAIYGPEHGFRGDNPDGAKISDGVDSKTGLPIFSLYGKNRKPTPEMMQGIDVMIFDIQDVGARFYTFISTMHYAMEASAEAKIPFMVLDRPNPNGNYVDGPIREEEYKTFVGMHPIPIVHGLTVGELAMMINEEGWLDENLKVDLKVIGMKGYKHSDEYSLPVKPSPNLPTDLAVRLYPSLCLIEGTEISEGRGTYEAFQQIGHPSFEGQYEHSFTPQAIEGMSVNPKHKGVTCYGVSFVGKDVPRAFTLKYLLEFYHAWESDEPFFRGSFTRLAGTEDLQKQIEQGMTEEEIRSTWEPALSQFKELRIKYLLYEE